MKVETLLRRLSEGSLTADDRSLVLVAGKGHEDYQITGETRIPFSDQDVLRSKARRARCA